MGIGDIFKIKQFKERIAGLETENQTLSQNNADLQAATTELRGKLSEIGGFDYYKVKSMTEQMEKEYAVKQRDLSIEYDVKVDTLKKEYERKQAEAEKGLREQLVQLERMTAFIHPIILIVMMKTMNNQKTAPSPKHHSHSNDMKNLSKYLCLFYTCLHFFLLTYVSARVIIIS